MKLSQETKDRIKDMRRHMTGKEIARILRISEDHVLKLTKGIKVNHSPKKRNKPRTVEKVKPGYFDPTDRLI